MSNKKSSWILITAIFILSWFFSYGNRMILSPLLEMLKGVWNLDHTGLGLISSSLFVAYFLGQLPGGIIADKWGRRNLLAIGLILQGLAVIASGLFNSVYAFTFFRILTGVGQATLFTCIFGLISEIVPQKKQVIVTSIVHAAMPLGTMYGLLVVSQLTLKYGYPWGSSFVISGIATALVGVAAVAVMGRKKPKKAVSDECGEESIKQKGANPFELLKNKQIMVLSLIAFMESYGTYVMLTWLPFYLKYKGFSSSEAGQLASLSSVLTVPATVIIGLIANKLGRIKPLLIVFMLVSAICYFFIASFTSKTVLVIMLLLYGCFGRMTTAPLHISLVSYASRPENRSTALGIFNTFAAIPMFLAPVITGWLFDKTNYFETSIYLAVIIQIASLILLTFGIKEAAAKKQTRGVEVETAGK